MIVSMYVCVFSEKGLWSVQVRHVLRVMDPSISDLRGAKNGVCLLKQEKEYSLSLLEPLRLLLTAPVVFIPLVGL